MFAKEPPCTLGGAHGVYRLVMRVSRVRGSGSETWLKYTILVSSHFSLYVVAFGI